MIRKTKQNSRKDEQKMLYEVGMLCKHFKGNNLLEKNIYRIEKIGVNGKDIDTSTITYTGDGTLETATNLVVYANIFQDDKLFAREYEDIAAEMSKEKQTTFGQIHKVEPLTEEEKTLIQTSKFSDEKKALTLVKFKK